MSSRPSFPAATSYGRTASAEKSRAIARVKVRGVSCTGSSNFVYEQSDTEVNAPDREFSPSALRVFRPVFECFSESPALSDSARARGIQQIRSVLRQFAPKLSDSLVNTPPGVNKPVPSGPRKSVFGIQPILTLEGRGSGCGPGYQIAPEDQVIAEKIRAPVMSVARASQ